MADTIVWISGATEGLGAGFVQSCPYPDARVINLSRREHPELESVVFDLTEPSTWSTVTKHFAHELAQFQGERAVFVHNAFFPATTAFVGEIDPDVYRQDVLANVAAAMILGDGFVRAVRPGYESGLAMLSSAAAAVPFEGQAVYCGAKAGIEQWVRVVRRERQRRGTGPWVVAIRPGFVDTPGARAAAAMDPHGYPIAPLVAAGLAAGEAMPPRVAAAEIWAALPPDAGTSVLKFGAMPTGVGRQGEGMRDG